jgi:hypothetical protein
MHVICKYSCHGGKDFTVAGWKIIGRNSKLLDSLLFFPTRHRPQAAQFAHPNLAGAAERFTSHRAGRH